MTTKTLYAPGLSSPGIIARCDDLDGHSCRIGWCLYEQLTKIFKVPGLGDYDHDGDADCLDYWKAAEKRGKVVKTTDPDKIPIGALLIWSAGNGHAATYLGKSKIFGTDLPTRGKFGVADITRPHTQWGHTLLGYVEVDGNGFTLLRAEAPKPKPPKLDVYRVTAKTGLKAHVAPTLTSKVDHIARLGTKITAVKIVVTGARHFVVDAKKHYYAKEYLEKV